MLTQCTYVIYTYIYVYKLVNEKTSDWQSHCRKACNVNQQVKINYQYGTGISTQIWFINREHFKKYILSLNDLNNQNLANFIKANGITYDYTNVCQTYNSEPFTNIVP